MATVIEKNYRDYDGFVIIHGTDTMAYTASTLSFMFENLNKTVVVTGSQIPISQLRSDAVDNLLGALMVAGPFQIPEVVIYFDNKIIRGNRATKESSCKMAAFASPNMPPLAIFDVSLAVEWHRILKHNKGTFKVFRDMNTNIAQITLSPLFTNWSALDHLFKNSSAVILSGYGMGNLPINNQILMDTIRSAVENGVFVVVSTQCHHGTVSDIYATGRFLTEMGCILAQDMTLECLFAKLSYLIGKVSKLITSSFLKLLFLHFRAILKRGLSYCSTRV